MLFAHLFQEKPNVEPRDDGCNHITRIFSHDLSGGEKAVQMRIRFSYP